MITWNKIRRSVVVISKLNARRLFLNPSLILYFLKIKKRIMPLPFYMQIEPTNRCNLKCIYCTRSRIAKNEINQDLKFELLEKIISENKNLIMIKLQGLGEPLLTKDFIKMLELIKKNGIYLSITTNGTLFSHGNNIELLIKYFNDINISIDSLDKGVLENLRPGTRHEQLLENIRLLASRASSHPETRIRINFVVCEENFMEIPEIIEYFSPMNIQVNFTEVENWSCPGEEGWEESHQKVLSFRKNKLNFFGKLSAQKSNSDKYENIFKRSSVRKGKCDWGFYKAFVSFSGNITPCCIRMENRYSMGIISEQNGNIHNLWNNKELLDFRDAHLNNKFYPICEFCPD